MKPKIENNPNVKGYKQPSNKPGMVKNPKGKPKGAVNAVTFDVKKRLATGVDENFMANLFSEIEAIESVSEKVKARIKVVEFFVPKPKDPEEAEKDNAIRDKLLAALLLK